jgi:NADH-quinone oxidoreductase subunit M
VVLITIPLLGALICFFTSGETAKRISLGISLICFGYSAWMIKDFNTDGSLNHVLEFPWMGYLGSSFKLAVDGIGMLMVLLTTTLVPVIIGTAWQKRYSGSFFGLILLMQVGLLGVFSSYDGLLFYLFWELTLIPIYFICAIWGDEQRIKITLKFFIYTFFGSIFMLISLIYLYLKTPGTHSFSLDALSAVTLTEVEAAWVMLGFFLAFGIKMPIFPFHTWQPDTYTSAPSAGTMLLSGIMLKMGIFGLIRWMVPLTIEAAPWFHYIIILCVIGVVYGSIIAIKQQEIKRLIAYSSIAHVGLIGAGMMTLSNTGIQGGLVQMISHGINVVGLFFIAQIIEDRTGIKKLKELGGIAKLAPSFAVFSMIIVLGSVAVPLTNGFVGEFMLLKSIFDYWNILGLFAGLTIIYAAVYMLRMYQHGMFGDVSVSSFSDLKDSEWLVLGILGAFVVGIGFYPDPILSLTEGSVQKLIASLR